MDCDATPRKAGDSWKFTVISSGSHARSNDLQSRSPPADHNGGAPLLPDPR
jgi:hypothetical protein